VVTKRRERKQYVEVRWAHNTKDEGALPPVVCIAARSPSVVHQADSYSVYCPMPKNGKRRVRAVLTYDRAIAALLDKQPAYLLVGVCRKSHGPMSRRTMGRTRRRV
jgi:hypothetical protein